MTIELIVIGKTDSKEIAALVELYARRVNHYCRFAVTALPDVRNTKSMTVRQQRTAEGEAIQIVRAIFAEQIYRAFTILNNEPYHHE